MFILNDPWYKAVHRRGVDGYRVYPKTVTDHGIVELYQQTRTPQAEPVAPFDVETIARITTLHEKAASHYVN